MAGDLASVSSICVDAHDAGSISRVLPIFPKFAGLIVDGQKVWELRKKPFRCINNTRIGIAAARGADVIGTAYVEKIEPYTVEELVKQKHFKKHKTSEEFIRQYARNQVILYVHVLSDARRFGNPLRHTPVSGPSIRNLLHASGGFDAVWAGAVDSLRQRLHRALRASELSAVAEDANPYAAAAAIAAAPSTAATSVAAAVAPPALMGTPPVLQDQPSTDKCIALPTPIPLFADAFPLRHRDFTPRGVKRRWSVDALARESPVKESRDMQV